MMSTWLLLLWAVLTGVTAVNVTVIVQINTYGKVLETNLVGRPCNASDIAADRCQGGLARKSTLFQKIVNETNGNVVFVDMGNLLAVDGMYKFYRGALQSYAMHPFNFTAMVPRNLDWSVDENEPDAFRVQSGIRIVSANIVNKRTLERAYMPYGFRQLPNGLKVAVIGSNNVSNTAGVSFFKNFTTVNRIGFTGEAIGRAKNAGADIVIVADNSGGYAVECPDDDCLPEFPSMDIHIVNRKAAYGKQTVFSCEDSCSFGRSVLRIDITLDGQRVITNISSAIVPIKMSIPKDPLLWNYLRKAIDDYRQATSTNVVGAIDFNSTFSMQANDTDNFSHSTGDIVADAVMFKARALGFKPDLAIVNKGAIRDVFQQGNITKNQIESVVPFSDTISVFNISGGYLLQALQAATKLSIDNAFPEVAGMRFSWAPNLDNGDLYGRITNITFLRSSGPEALSVDVSYTVATIEFVRQGGDEYRLLSKNGRDFHDHVSTLVDAIVDFISHQKVLHKSNYQSPRGSIVNATEQRLTGLCSNESYLDDQGSCRACPKQVDGQKALWSIVAWPPGNGTTSYTIRLINNGPIAVIWGISLVDIDQFSVHPTEGVLEPSKYVTLSVTQREASVSVPSIRGNIVSKELTGVRKCYDLIPLNIQLAITRLPYHYPAILFDIVAICFTLVTASVVVIGVVLYVYRGSPMIRAASPALLLVNLFGALVLNSASLSFASDLDTKYGDVVCELRWWLTCLGFTLMFSPLFMKIYRIDKIFVSSSMRVVYIPNATLLRGIGLMAAAMITFLVIHSIAFPSVREIVLSPSLPTPSVDTKYEIAQCTSDQANLAIVLTACVLLTLWGTRIAWHSRNVPSDFNESSSIAVSLVFVVIYCLLVLPLQFLLRSNPDVQVLLRGVGVNVGVAVSLASFYLGKLDLICRGRANRIPSIGPMRHSAARAQAIPFSDFDVAIA